TLQRSSSSPAPTPTAPLAAGPSPRPVRPGRLHQRALDETQGMRGVEVVAAAREAALELAPHRLQRLAPGAGQVEEVGDGALAVLGCVGRRQRTVRERAVQRGDAVLVYGRGHGHGLLLSMAACRARFAAVRSTVPTARGRDP